MRICMLVYNPLTHDARVFREARTLAELGHEVEVIGRLRDGTRQAEDREGFRIHRVSTTPLDWRGSLRLLPRRAYRLPGDIIRRLFPPLRRWWPPPRSRPRRRWMRRRSLPYRLSVLRDFGLRVLMHLDGSQRFDVFHAHDLDTLAIGAKAARRFGALLVYDAHEFFPERSVLGPAERAYWRWRERRLIHDADRVVTVSDPIAEELAFRYGIQAPTVLRNCPDIPASLPTGTGRLRAQAQLDGDEGPIVLYQGGLQIGRGLESLIRAAKRLDRGTVVILGDGALLPSLRRLAQSEGVEKRVRFADPVAPDQLISYTAEAAVGVVPTDGRGLSSRWQLPNKLFEYLAAGLPVVATSLPTLERIVKDHEVGLTCEPGDAAGLAVAINRLLSDSDLYERCRRNAIEASKIYNWERESAKLVALYSELAPATPDL